MDLNPYIDDLRRHLDVAAAAGGEEARKIAERLVAPLESAARLVLLDVLSAAAAEITTELAPGSVDVRLRGRDPQLVVTSPPTEQSFGEQPASTQASAPPPVDSDEGNSSRLTLRLSEQLKLQVEKAAGRDGLSVNSWLVRVAASAADPDRERRSATTGNTSQRLSGWVR
ncbi:hypothetical protein [Aeromicrobium sp.]|uniref:hypothetical protein n=1 Tax=Aeromicrobium sp. TaxID=1871063 RepID=UPI0030C236BD